MRASRNWSDCKEGLESWGVAPRCQCFVSLADHSTCICMYPSGKFPRKSIQHVLIAIHEEADLFNNSFYIKCNFCNFTLWLPGSVVQFVPPLHDPAQNSVLNCSRALREGTSELVCGKMKWFHLPLSERRMRAQHHV